MLSHQDSTQTCSKFDSELARSQPLARIISGKQRKCHSQKSPSTWPLGLSVSQIYGHHWCFKGTIENGVPAWVRTPFASIKGQPPSTRTYKAWAPLLSMQLCLIFLSWNLITSLVELCSFCAKAVILGNRLQNPNCGQLESSGILWGFLQLAALLAKLLIVSIYSFLVNLGQFGWCQWNYFGVKAGCRNISLPFGSEQLFIKVQRWYGLPIMEMNAFSLGSNFCFHSLSI